MRKSEGRFGKQDFAYLADEDVYRCPAGEKLRYYYTNEENGQKLRNYWTNACRTCPLKPQCTTGPQRRIKRWEHEDVLEAVQERLDKNSGRDAHAARDRRASVRHTEDADGRDALPVKTLPKVATEMALRVLGYNLTRVMNIVGDQAADGGGQDVERALARAVAVHRTRERVPTLRQDEFWSSGRKICPN